MRHRTRRGGGGGIMTGIETDAVLFHGVDRGWMQAQWRDCRDKAEQLKIFRDMVGRNVPPQEILDAVGEPEYCGPIDPVKRERRRWTPEEDARIAEMIREGRSYAEIGAELDRNGKAVGMRIVQLRRRGVIEPAQKKEKAEPVFVPAKKPEPEDEPEKAGAEPVSEPEKVPEKPDAYPDGGALPLEIGDLPGADALEAVAETLRALLDEEEMLCDRCRVVQDMIAAYRAKLRELLAMAGGGLIDGEE